MIVELELLAYKPRTEARVAAAYADGVAAGRSPSPLLGYWTVDVGRLNSSALLWSFADAAEREGALAAAASRSDWPPDVGGAVTAAESFVLEPAPFNVPLEPHAYGALYEIRIYDYESGSIGTVIERWARLVEARAAISPLVGCFFSGSGPTDKWVHIWAYNDAAERQRARADAVSRGVWPPDTGEWLIRQENMLVLPTAFSGLH